MDLALKIAGLYDTMPEAEFSIRQIAARLKATYSFVYKAVDCMVKDGVLSVAVKGRAKMCALNLESDRAIGLLAMYSVLRKEEFIRRNRIVGEMLSELVKRVSGAEVYSIILFGSYAKGSASEKSDVDLLVVGGSRARLSEKVNAEANTLQARYGKELNPIVLDKAMFLKSFRAEESTVVKEAVYSHVLLFGFENFWKLVKEGLG